MKPTLSEPISREPQDKDPADVSTNVFPKALLQYLLDPSKTPKDRIRIVKFVFYRPEDSEDGA